MTGAEFRLKLAAHENERLKAELKRALEEIDYAKQRLTAICNPTKEFSMSDLIQMLEVALRDHASECPLAGPSTAKGWSSAALKSRRSAP